MFITVYSGVRKEGCLSVILNECNAAMGVNMGSNGHISRTSLQPLSRLGSPLIVLSVGPPVGQLSNWPAIPPHSTGTYAGPLVDFKLPEGDPLKHRTQLALELVGWPLKWRDCARQRGCDRVAPPAQYPNERPRIAEASGAFLCVWMVSHNASRTLYPSGASTFSESHAHLHRWQSLCKLLATSQYLIFYTRALLRASVFQLCWRRSTQL